jgi:tRNA G18 (ribose-2'-O)-methylase SpoU
VGITPAPVDRFGRDRSDIAKSALGAEKTISWVQRDNLAELILELKNEGYKIIALEQDERSVDYKNVEVGAKNAFILGTEVSGLSKDILDICDVIAEIPMKGEKESLNVSVSFGVAIFRILNI